MIIPVYFGGADLAAAASLTSMPLLGEPDIADILNIQFPFPVTLIGAYLGCANASGDTLTAELYTGTTAQAAPILGVTNAIKQVSWWGGPADTNFLTVAAGTTIGAQYITTTGGTYTAKDVYLVYFFQAAPGSGTAGALS